MGWPAAWRAMRGNTWRLFALLLLAYVPIFVAAGVTLGIVLTAAHVEIEQATAHPTWAFVLLQGVLDTVIQFVFIALGATVFVEVYRRLVLSAPAGRSAPS